MSVDQVSIGSDNGLSPIRCQAIIGTIARILSIGLIGTNFSDILIKIQNFSVTKTHLKKLSAKWQPFCPGGDELTPWNLVMYVNLWTVLSLLRQWLVTRFSPCHYLIYFILYIINIQKWFFQNKISCVIYKMSMIILRLQCANRDASWVNQNEINWCVYWRRYVHYYITENFSFQDKFCCSEIVLGLFYMWFKMQDSPPPPPK